MKYLKSIGGVYDDAAQDALFTHLAEERGITVKDVNAQLIRQMLNRVRRVTEEFRTNGSSDD
jgi:hypothetical protein